MEQNHYRYKDKSKTKKYLILFLDNNQNVNRHFSQLSS